jgi:UV DNA damage repair endonuclease
MGWVGFKKVIYKQKPARTCSRSQFFQAEAMLHKINWKTKATSNRTFCQYNFSACINYTISFNPVSSHYLRLILSQEKEMAPPKSLKKSGDTDALSSQKLASNEPDASLSKKNEPVRLH